MTRYSPWRPDAAPDREADLLLEEVLGPSLKKAFPLPRNDGPAEAEFRRVLHALAWHATGARSG